MTETTSGTVVGPLMTPTPTVQQAWSSVMGDIRGLGKHEQNKAQGFNFRGIDAVMNLTGPVLRAHGVTVLPYARDIQRRDFTTAKGTVMRETVVLVDYVIVGPDGDQLTGCAYGEASDAGDKSTPKAMSVAYRTFLLQALCLPTDEPDPDSEVHDRGTAAPTAVEVEKTRDGLIAATDIDTVKRVEKWAHDKGLLTEQTTDAEGNSIPLHRLFEDTLARLGDTTGDEAAKKVLEDSLGATEVPAETEGAKA